MHGVSVSKPDEGLKMCVAEYEYWYGHGAEALVQDLSEVSLLFSFILKSF